MSQPISARFRVGLAAKGGLLLALGAVFLMLGEATAVAGAVALHSRRSGLSFQLPDGRFGEFLLWNTWEQLSPGASYALLLARRSRVVVAAPQRVD